MERIYESKRITSGITRYLCRKTTTYHYYYLWAGNLVEEGYKPFVLQSFQKNKAISKGIVTADLKELSIGEIEEKVRTVKNMAVVIV